MVCEGREREDINNDVVYNKQIDGEGGRCFEEGKKETSEVLRGGDSRCVNW